MEKHRKSCTGKAEARDCSDVREACWQTPGRNTCGCSQVRAGRPLSAAPCPRTLSTLTSEHRTQSTQRTQHLPSNPLWKTVSLRSSKTLTPATRPLCSRQRPASQQGLLWRGRLHSSHSPGPTSGNSGFPTKISLCPTPPLPGSHHSSASNSDLPSGAGDVQPRNCVTSHRQGSLCHISVLKRTKYL